MKVIFLDVDGVLNNMSEEFGRLQREHQTLYIMQQSNIDQLNKLVELTGASIVVSSTWRYSFKMRTEMCDQLTKWGFKYPEKVIGRTPLRTEMRKEYYHDVKFSRDMARGREIKQWLADNKGVSSFVILDDDSDMDDLKPRLVQTSTYAGLTAAEVDRAVEILNTPL